MCVQVHAKKHADIHIRTYVGRGGALIESIAFNWRVMGSTPARDLGQVLNSHLPVALRLETSAQYPCCVGSASE